MIGMVADRWFHMVVGCYSNICRTALVSLYDRVSNRQTGAGTSQRLLHDSDAN